MSGDLEKLRQLAVETLNRDQKQAADEYDKLLKKLLEEIEQLVEEHLPYWIEFLNQVIRKGWCGARLDYTADKNFWGHYSFSVKNEYSPGLVPKIDLGAVFDLDGFDYANYNLSTGKLRYKYRFPKFLADANHDDATYRILSMIFSDRGHLGGLYASVLTKKLGHPFSVSLSCRHLHITISLNNS